MSFKVQEQPKKIYEAVTYEFKLEDEDGNVYHLRKWEDGDGGGFYINKDGIWEDFYPEDDLLDFIDYDLDF